MSHLRRPNVGGAARTADCSSEIAHGSFGCSASVRILSRFVKTFHFHRRQDERSNALGIVADAGLADVVLVRAVAVRTAAEARDLAGVFQADVTRSGVD